MPGAPLEYGGDISYAVFAAKERALGLRPQREEHPLWKQFVSAGQALW
jgi:hypothetical protein